MKAVLTLALLLTCAACSQDDAPAEEIADAAEEIVAPEPAPLAKGEWAPRDDCGAAEGSAQFRERLAAAVEARDADALVTLVAEDVALDFGGGAGTAELRARLADRDRQLWDELDSLMALGCAANDEGGITLPWYFAQDLGETDPYAAFVVMGEDVPVLTEPRATADRLDTISWDLVEVASYDPEAPFQEIKVADGGTGFVATGKLRSLIDYRLLASNRDGRWRITAFVAGD